MTDARLKYGDVVRVDPVASPQVKQPDDRRWMVVACARTDRAAPWTLLYCGPDIRLPSRGSVLVSHWRTMTGFIRVDE